MAKVKRRLARKAAKSTAKHTARGTAAKVKRSPVRTATLLSIGAVAGALATWFVGRGHGSATDGPKAQSA